MLYALYESDFGQVNIICPVTFPDPWGNRKTTTDAWANSWRTSNRNKRARTECRRNDVGETFGKRRKRESRRMCRKTKFFRCYFNAVRRSVVKHNTRCSDVPTRETNVKTNGRREYFGQKHGIRVETPSRTPREYKWLSRGNFCTFPISRA